MVARVLQLPAASVDLQQPLNNLGLDSLMALELFTRIEKTFGQTLSPATTLQAPTVEQLANILSAAFAQTDGKKVRTVDLA